MNQPLLTYNETSLPGVDLDARLKLAQLHNLALEVANNDNFSGEIYQRSLLPIAAVQAYKMHDFHPLHPDVEYRQMAFSHALETLEIAARLNASHIVTVCGFGHNLVDRPYQRCFDFFSQLGDRAARLGIKIAIEPLSPLRVGIFNTPEEVVQLIEDLDRREVFYLLLDTGHLADSGIDLNAFFYNWKYPFLELQLKDLKSYPPHLETLTDLKFITQLPAVFCVEHRQPITMIEFERLINSLKSWLSLLTDGSSP